MAIHICVSEFGRDWDGTYEQIEVDIYAQLPDYTYWIFHDSWYWYVSTSEYLYGEPRCLAQKEFIHGIVDPTGAYLGIGDEPDGIISSGECE